MPKRKHIGIVGGGMLGMTLALRLREQGFQVSLLEAAPHLGGLTSPTKIGDYVWDQFYHVLLLSDDDLLSLLEKIGLRDQIHWNYTKTGFFTDGHLYSMSNIKEFLSFPPLGLYDKIRLGFTIFYASRMNSQNGLEEIGVEDWLVRLSGKRTFQKIWLPLLKSKLGENYRLSSASFIWASIARMYAARRSGLKREMFGSVPGGYATILNRFQSFLEDKGVQILFERLVSKVMASKTHTRVETEAGDHMEFEDVILTVPCNHLPGLCPQLSTVETRRLQGVIYGGVICPCFMLKRSLGDYYITNITEEWPPFTAVIEMTAVVDKGHFNGNSLIYLPRYLTQDDPLWRKPDEEVQDKFIQALEAMHPSFHRSDIVASRITKAREVFPVPTINYSKDLLPPTQTSLEHVFIVNSAQIPSGTMNVNEIVGLANKKAVELAKLVGG